MNTENNNILLNTINAHDLKIDEEYKNLIRPLSDQEFAQLEENILQNGILNPIIVTNDNTIIDGHHRHRIALKYNLPIPIKVMNFNNRSDTELWIIKNQFSRRNLSKYERGLLALKLKPIIAASAKENQGKRTDLTSVQNLTNVDTKKEIAKIAEISHSTLAKIEKIDNEATDEMKQLIKNRKLSIDKAYKQLRNSNTNSSELGDNPFSDEEAKLLDEIETSAARFILFIHNNKSESQKANINLEKCKEKLDTLAQNAKRSGNRRHFNLLNEEKAARIERGKNFGIRHESEVGDSLNNTNYEPFGNSSIVLSSKTSEVTIKDYQNLLVSIKISKTLNEIQSLIDEFEKKYTSI